MAKNAAAKAGPADPVEKLKDEMNLMRADNIEHIISKDQAF